MAESAPGRRRPSTLTGPGWRSSRAEPEQGVRRREDRMGLARRINDVGVQPGKREFGKVPDDTHLVEGNRHHRSRRQQREAEGLSPELQEVARPNRNSRLGASGVMIVSRVVPGSPVTLRDAMIPMRPRSSVLVGERRRNGARSSREQLRANQQLRLGGMQPPRTRDTRSFRSYRGRCAAKS